MEWLAPTFGLLGVIVGGLLQAALSSWGDKRRAWEAAVVDACLLRDELVITRNRVTSALDSGIWGAVLDPGLPYAAGLWAVEHREGHREPSVWPESGRRLAPFVRRNWETVSAPFLRIAMLSDRRGMWTDKPDRRLSEHAIEELQILVQQIDCTIRFLDEVVGSAPTPASTTNS